MNYREARSCIDESKRFGHEMNLTAIKELLFRMNNPEQDLTYIHIAGTNGKGSVNAHIASVLEKAGYRVGRFISPTLYGYRERIQINREWISEEDFTKGMEIVWPIVCRMHEEGRAVPSPFEIETAISFWYFREKKCDLVSLECGMGGTTDATNVITNTKIAIITSVSMDHMEFLGDTPAKIAENKAGILKPGAVLVTGRQLDEVTKTLASCAASGGNKMVRADMSKTEIIKSTFDEQIFSYEGNEYTIHLAGVHQIENALIAIEALKELNNCGFTVPDDCIREGMKETKWPGRFTKVCDEPLCIVDGAHNPDAAARLKSAIEQYFPDRTPVFIMGMLKDKQVDKICSMMGPMAREIFTIETPDNDRALSCVELADKLKKLSLKATACENFTDAVCRAKKAAGRDGLVICFGSLSFIGDLTTALEEN